MYHSLVRRLWCRCVLFSINYFRKWSRISKCSQSLRSIWYINYNHVIAGSHPGDHATASGTELVRAELDTVRNLT